MYQDETYNPKEKFFCDSFSSVNPDPVIRPTKTVKSSANSVLGSASANRYKSVQPGFLACSREHSQKIFLKTKKYLVGYPSTDMTSHEVFL